MDKTINVFVRDASGAPAPNAEVRWLVQKDGKEVTLGSATTQGLDDKPVSCQIAGAWDDEVVTVEVHHSSLTRPKRIRVAQRSSPNVTVTLNGPDPLRAAVHMLERAVKSVPEARYYWGVVGAGATVAIIGALAGRTTTTAVAIVATFSMAVIFFAFTRIEKTKDIWVKLAGYMILLSTACLFVVFMLSTASVALICKPGFVAHLIGMGEYCDRESGLSRPAASGAGRVDAAAQTVCGDFNKLGSDEAFEKCIESASHRNFRFESIEVTRRTPDPTNTEGGASRNHFFRISFSWKPDGNAKSTSITWLYNKPTEVFKCSMDLNSSPPMRAEPAGPPTPGLPEKYVMEAGKSYTYKCEHISGVNRIVLTAELADGDKFELLFPAIGP